MLGRLYPANDARQDAAYRLLYAAFNVGGLLAPAVAGGLSRAGRWDVAFLLAAMAMGVAVLLLSGLILTSLAPTRTSTITSPPPSLRAARQAHALAGWPS